MNRTPTLLLLLPALLACGSDSAGGAGEPTDRTTYPVAAYGKAEGSVIADLKFQAPDGSEYSLNTVFAEPKNRVMLLTTTAGWCTACIEEQPKLAQIYQELGSKGLIVVAALFEDSDFQPATTGQAKEWVERYKTPYPLVVDAGFQLAGYYDRTATPMNMVVDVDTMTILKITTGFDEAAIRAVIEANLDL
jgi:thiol-disulfide isomerase/thioredoxin